MFEERKQQRFHDHGKIISRKLYNLVLGGTLLYGFAVNILLVILFQNHYFNPFALLIGYTISCIFGVFLSAKSKNPWISFVGYNLIAAPIGLLLPQTVPSFSDETIINAFMGAAIISAAFIILGVLLPNLFVRMGRTLFVSLLILVLVEFVMMLFGKYMVMFDYIGIAIFALYIGYDFAKSQAYPSTIDNAVDSAVDLYSDIIQIFLRLLSILERNSSDKS